MGKKFVIFTQDFLSNFLVDGRVFELSVILQEIAQSGVGGIFISNDIDFLMNTMPGTVFQFKDACLLDCSLCEGKSAISSVDLEDFVKYRKINISEACVIAASPASLSNFCGNNLKFIVVSGETNTGGNFRMANQLSELPGMIN